MGQPSSPFLRVIASHQAVPLFTRRDVTLKCPAGYVPTQLSIKRSHPEILAVNGYRLIDSKGAAVDYTLLTSVAQIVGGGYLVSIENTEDEGAHENAELRISCLDPSVSADHAVILTRASIVTYGQSTASISSFCTADYPVALGGFGDADGLGLYDQGSAPVWGSESNPQHLNDASPAVMGPPTGMNTQMRSESNGLATITAFTICGNVPAARTYLYSTAPTASSVFGPVPDGWTAVGAGFTGLADASVDVWLQDGVVVDEEQFYPTSTDYDSGSAPIRAFIVRSAEASSGTSAMLAVIVVPQSDASAAPTIVPSVEFYNAGLDHYFMTANPSEIGDLDAGVHRGWTRTGQSFNVYAIGSTGHPERHPVCRAYGVPAAGLDSHFYSASPEECFAVALKFADAWALESDEVFEADLPDEATGQCPNGDVPVYRLWNNRLDSNHRYTTSTAIRDQMLASGYVAEGYGPRGVALCALT
jgi:hypothetical protein